MKLKNFYVPLSAPFPVKDAEYAQYGYNNKNNKAENDRPEIHNRICLVLLNLFISVYLL